MIALSTATNYLSPEDFDKFLKALPKLEIYHIVGKFKPPLLPSTLQLLFKMMYTSALRVSECLALTPSDFNIKRRILTIRQAKTGRDQKTTIVPSMLKELDYFFQSCEPEKPIFDTTRQTVWRYAKNASILAGLDLFEQQKKREIEGAWTHLFRKSYAKWMLSRGASIPLIQVKLRHTHKQSVEHYIQSDINALIEWEAEQFPPRLKVF